jgi:Uma2 family endonuclease
VVEIFSPSTRRTDVLVKSGVYARFGIPSYWMVDPDLDRIEFYRLEEGAYRLKATVSSPEVAEPLEFPGMRIPLKEVFG